MQALGTGKPAVKSPFAAAMFRGGGGAPPVAAADQVTLSASSASGKIVKGGVLALCALTPLVGMARPQPMQAPLITQSLSTQTPVDPWAKAQVCTAADPSHVPPKSIKPFFGADPPDPAYAAAVEKDLGSSDTVHTFGRGHQLEVPRYSSLTDKQQSLLKTFYRTDDKSAAVDWDITVLRHPDWATTFLSNTNAMNKLHLVMDRAAIERDEKDHIVNVSEDKPSVRALDMVDSLVEMQGDRVDFNFNPALFNDWQKEGGVYYVHLPNGHEKDGHLKFNKNTLYGSLHKGFDDQGYTFGDYSPRIHMSVEYDGCMSDMHLDYRTPWKFHILPNPLHLLYENSVVIQHTKTYSRVFGDPGFKVVDPPPPVVDDPPDN